MRIAAAIRKSVKWGGAALAVVLLVAWIGSGWCYVSTPHFGSQDFMLAAGTVGCYRFNETIEGSGTWAWEERSPSLHLWRFFYRDTKGYTLLVIPLWAPFLLTLIVTVFAWRADIIARRRAMLGKCAKCGYARAGLAPDAVCPECGTAANPASAPTPAPSRALSPQRGDGL